ncbi:hypothetical protein BUALT_Bualt03G0140400 [Buddleja alternifolia]|uniref:Uncharacterized protein n=1 Tax=Buddleja alternifolia TaxID=168488 RepID=A0AAV6Y204_9LAMI|nr:hypothetical protein BUALT_Bualt03G0140400 [Buddleja alternifolia]
MKITGGGGEVEDRAFEGFVAPQYRFPLHPTTYERDDRWFSSESGAIWIGCTRGGDANLAAKSDQPKPAIKKSKEGCKDQDYVKLALQQVGGDVDDAVEFLVAEEESLDQIVSHDESYHSENNLSDNLIYAIDGLSARVSQLETRTHNLENSVDDMKVSLGNNHGSIDGKMRQMENILREEGQKRDTLFEGVSERLPQGRYERWKKARLGNRVKRRSSPFLTETLCIRGRWGVSTVSRQLLLSR